MDTRARARNPRNPPPFTIRFIEYDNSIAITPADFLPSKHDVFTNFCVFNFFHGGKRGKYLADSLYLPHFLFRVLRAITTCRPMFSSKYGIITVYLVRELSLSILNRVSHVQFQLSSLSLSLFSICWFSKRRCKYVVFNISLNRKISRVESIFDRNFRFLFSVKKGREREREGRTKKQGDENHDEIYIPPRSRFVFLKGRKQGCGKYPDNRFEIRIAGWKPVTVEKKDIR